MLSCMSPHTSPHEMIRPHPQKTHSAVLYNKHQDDNDVLLWIQKMPWSHGWRPKGSNSSTVEEKWKSEIFQDFPTVKEARLIWYALSLLFHSNFLVMSALFFFNPLFSNGHNVSCSETEKKYRIYLLPIYVKWTLLPQTISSRQMSG